MMPVVSFSCGFPQQGHSLTKKRDILLVVGGQRGSVEPSGQSLLAVSAGCLLSGSSFGTPWSKTFPMPARGSFCSEEWSPICPVVPRWLAPSPKSFCCGSKCSNYTTRIYHVLFNVRQITEYCPRKLLYFYAYYVWAAGVPPKQLWYHDAVLFRPPAALF